MPVNDKIRKPDYNTIRAKINNIIGNGSATDGWGQIVVASTEVDEGTKVSVNEWGRLRYDIINAYKHVFGTVPITAETSESTTVRYSTTFGPNSTTDAPLTQFDSHANLLIANKFTVHSSQSATFNWPRTSTTWPGSYGNTWNSRIQCLVTASWPTANNARHFFNSGGTINFKPLRTLGSLVNAQNNEWALMMDRIGTRIFGGNVPSSGTSPLDGKNYYRCTSTAQVWTSETGSTPYGSNVFRISARTPGVANNSTGTAASVEFLVEWIDGYIDPGPGGPPYTIDAVDGTFSLDVSHRYATGVLEPPGTGDFVVVQPTITVGTITP